MGPALIVGLLFLVYFDMKCLKRQDSLLFQKAFEVSIEKRDLLSVLLYTVFFPLYLVRRARFNKMIKGEGKDYPTTDDLLKVYLMADAVGVVLTWFLVVIVFSLVLVSLSYLFPVWEERLNQMVLTAVFSSCLLVVLIFRASRRYEHQGFCRMIGLAGWKGSLLKNFLVPAGLGVIFAVWSSAFLVARDSMPVTPLSEAIEATQSPTTFVFFLALAVLMAPLFEELIFRGYFFYVIKEYNGVRFAIYFVSFLFAFLHTGQYWGDWFAIFMVTCLGFTLTMLRAWSGTTIASIVMHYVYNGLIVILPLLLVVQSNPTYLKYKMLYHQLNSGQKEELLLESIDRYPHHADSYNDLAWLYAADNKNLNEALRLINIGLKYAPQYDMYLDTKAEVFYKMGRYSEAIAIEKQLLERYPDHPFYASQLKKFQEASDLDKEGKMINFMN